MTKGSFYYYLFLFRYEMDHINKAYCQNNQFI